MQEFISSPVLTVLLFHAASKASHWQRLHRTNKIDYLACLCPYVHPITIKQRKEAHPTSACRDSSGCRLEEEEEGEEARRGDHSFLHWEVLTKQWLRDHPHSSSGWVEPVEYCYYYDYAPKQNWSWFLRVRPSTLLEDVVTLQLSCAQRCTYILSRRGPQAKRSLEDTWPAHRGTGIALIPFQGSSWDRFHRCSMPAHQTLAVRTYTPPSPSALSPPVASRCRCHWYLFPLQKYSFFRSLQERMLLKLVRWLAV